MAIGMLNGCGLFVVEEEREPLESKDSYIRGIRYYHEGYYISASVELNNVPETHPQYPSAIFFLEKTNRLLSDVANYEKAAIDHETRGNLIEALHHIEHALNIYPKNKRIQKYYDKITHEIQTTAEINFNQGKSLYEEGKLDEAMIFFQKAYRLTPANRVMAEQLVVAYNTRALDYYRQGNLEQAIHDLKQSLTVDPRQETIQIQLQEMETRLGLLNNLSP